MNFKSLSFCLLFVGAFGLISQPAQAFVELRAGYGLLSPDESEAGDTLGGLTLDAMVSPPALGISLGLRYESLSDDDDGTKVTYERLSAQVAYEALDLVLFSLNLVAGVGLSESLKVSGGPKFDDGRAFNVGVLGSVGLGLVSLNAELGYHTGKVKGDVLPGVPTEIDLDGVYTKFLVGFGF